MKQLNRLFRLFAALSLRERLLAVAALVGAIYFVMDLTVLRPQYTEAKALREKRVQQEAELATLTKALQPLAATAATDPLAAQRAERDKLRLTYAQAESVISKASGDVRLGELIRTMIAAKPGLTLVSLKTVPPQIFFKSVSLPTTAAPVAGPASAPMPAASSASSEVATSLPNLYKHGVDATVRGNYLTLVSYLQGLERNPNVYWGPVKVDVVTYPDATLNFAIYTLSARPELPLD